ncbi:MAG: amidase domain-containing protein, partial [Clostridia bacterium]|nr:amidase domain-containing protein [Clostridia bacterium]
KWAYRRNPVYLDFSRLGGDCTNFASQCLYAGAGVMNDTPTFGWFYKTAAQRAPAWTGVQYLYDFLTRNLGDGPFAREVSIEQLEAGDLVQLATGENQIYHHTPFVVRIDGAPSPGTVFIAAHSNDCDCRLLSTYAIRKLRCLHIEGVRKA